MSSRCIRTTPVQWVSRALAVLLPVVLALPVPVWAAQELVVVRKTGQASSYVSQSKVAGATAACLDESVAFAFTVEPHDGIASIQLQRGTDVSRDIVIDVTLTCSSLNGTALVPFDALGGSASSGTDFLSTPGVAMLNLDGGLTGGGSSPPVSATVGLQLIENGQTGTQTLSIVRTEGSFQGTFADGGSVVGSIPGSNTPIVTVTILGQATIEDGAGAVPGIDPAADQVSTATAQFCAPGGGGFGTIGCAATQSAANLVADPATPSDVREAAIVVLENNLLAVAPDETTAIAFMAPAMALAQANNLGGRLAELRSGEQGGTVSAGGLTFLSHGIPVSFGSLASLLRVDDDESAGNEEKRTLLGGTRLGFWINGTLGSSDSNRRSSNSGFESDTWSLTSGLDYRFTDRFFAGVALGYSSMNADFASDQGSLDASAKSLFVYSGYSTPNGFSFDGSVSYMRSDYSQKRVIELFELDGSGTGYQSMGRDIASGDPTVNQYGANFGVTYTIMRNTWTIAPQAQISLLRTTYEAFQERGPSEFNLSYDERRNNSRSFSVGGYFDRSFATSVGAFRPYLRAFYFADSGSTPDLITQFVLAGSDGSQVPLSIDMQEPDRRYGTAELGLGFSRPIGTRTVDFNFGYLQTFSFQDLDRWAVRFDVRFPL
jgi:outer membrane autotransporter protein